MMKNYIFIFVAAIILLGVQNSVNAADYVLTVAGGTGSGTYASGAEVNIVAGTPAPGEVFDRWVINGGKPVFGSIYSSATTLTMPLSATSITALYMPDGPYFDACDELVSETTPNGTFVRAGTTINTVDMLQGTGCIEYDQVAGNNSATLFQKNGFTTPVNTGATLANGIFRFRFWIEDPTKLGALLSIELRSGTEAAAEHQWNVTKANVVAGWNSFNLPFSAIGPLTGSNLGADPAAINYFRIYSTGAVGVKAKLDAMMVFDPTLIKVDPEITWANPADIAVNTALSGVQLNATSNIPGTFAYTPGNATILSVIETKELSVLYKPFNLHAFIYNSVTKTANIKVVESLSAVNNPTESTFNLYPNPLKNNGILNIKVAEQDNYTLRICNMSGQTIYKSNLNGSQTLNVNGVLKQGAYIVSLISSKSTRNQKLVVE